MRQTAIWKLRELMQKYLSFAIYIAMLSSPHLEENLKLLWHNPNAYPL